MDNAAEKDYSSTVNLPDTPFSMKANLTQKEPEMIKRWEKSGIYGRQQQKRAQAPAFILHDGPPYANGDIHSGHALNKILKDMILKYKFLRGYRTPYIPGWDCHGLPIELKVVEKLGEKANTIPPHALRRECRDYAGKFVKTQMEGFKRLGVFADWENPYLTMSADFEASIMEAFGLLVEKGYVYRGLRPIHWCLSCNTSLAEAEIEYHDHTSPSIYVKFPVAAHKTAALNGKKLSVLIWTTTPWTLPANTGLSFHPDESYVAAEIDGEYLIVAEKLLEAVLSVRELKADKVVSLARADLEAMDVRHAWIDRPSIVVFGSHVTMDTGTGIVHTAPGHGMEDYLVGLEYKLPMLSPVDDKGRFTVDVPEFKGKNVFEANPEIIEFLTARGRLYYTKNISHSYPHCWRCKNPIIFRSKPQWFFRVSDPRLQEMALGALSGINWVPEWGQQRIKNMLEGRPDWCLSRQRKWGVPIPAFYCEDCGETLLDKDSVAHVLSIIKKEGIDSWYQKDVADLLPAGAVCKKCGGKKFQKENDIMDVWFDSGVSHYAVLDKREGLQSPADVYLEGNDQYRGWFQSSLWPSLAIHGRAPYKNIITHGWVLDEQGRQMHKSLGNSVSPREVTDKFGADVLRLWVVTEDYRGDLRIGGNLVQKSADAYRKIRNTFRYMLGNLKGFDPSKALAYKDLLEIDRYALSMLYDLTAKVEKTFDSYEFYKGFREIYNFCSVDLSSFYLDVLKDRLYIYAPGSRERMSAQTVLNILLEHLTVMLSPILAFTTEEVYRLWFDQSEQSSVHLADWKAAPETWKDEALKAKYEALRSVRELALKAVEIIRTSGDNPIGSSLDAKLAVTPKNDAAARWLKETALSLRFIFIVSQVEITDKAVNPQAEDENAAVEAMRAEGAKCARCWNYSAETDPVTELCERCAPVVKARS